MEVIQSWWETLSCPGIDDHHSPSEVKRIKLTNRFGFISVVFTFPYIIGYWAFGYNALSLFSAALCIIYLSIPLISKYISVEAAKPILYITVLIHQFVIASSFGERAEVHLLYIALVLLPFVLYDYKKNVHWLFFYFFITVMALAGLYLTNFSLFKADSSTHVISAMNFAYKITTMAGVIVIISTSLYVAERAEQSLDEDNLFLEQQLTALFDNSYDAIFLIDNDERRIIKVNKRALELFEMSENELMGGQSPDLYSQLMDDNQLKKIQLGLTQDRFYQSEVSYRTSRGKDFWGALAVRHLTIHDHSFHMVRITDVTIQHEINEKIRTSLLEKETLLAEIHHRVKNNLAVISGLLSLQSSYIEDARARDLFEESRMRIHSMALIHDKLYQHETFAKIDFGVYISDLVTHIRSSYNQGAAEISFSITCNEIYLDLKYAVPCGLILNELISNAYKHAFKGRSKGEIRIVCTKMGEKFTMMVSDDGVGFEMEKALAEPVSLGLTLIAALADQVSGVVKTTCHDGTAFYISFEA